MHVACSGHRFPGVTLKLRDTSLLHLTLAYDPSTLSCTFSAELVTLTK